MCELISFYLSCKVNHFPRKRQIFGRGQLFSGFYFDERAICIIFADEFAENGRMRNKLPAAFGIKARRQKKTTYKRNKNKINEQENF